MTDSNGQFDIAEADGDSPLATSVFGWVEIPRIGNIIFLGLAILSTLLVLADFIIHRHTYFTAEGFPAFYALYGFVSFSFVVLMGWPLRRLISRDETFYDEDGADG